MRNIKDWEQGEEVIGLLHNETDVQKLAEAGIDCSRCGPRYLYTYGCRRRRFRSHVKIRYFPESHGYLCLECFLRAPLCSADDCDEIAVVKKLELCRECYSEQNKVL